VTRAASAFKGLGLGRVTVQPPQNFQVQRGGNRKKKVATEDPWFDSDVAETRQRLIAATRERHAMK
jgi:phosphoenolpyruvate-protein kinase (PTS system EI component)